MKEFELGNRRGSVTVESIMAVAVFSVVVVGMILTIRFVGNYDRVGQAFYETVNEFSQFYYVYEKTDIEALGEFIMDEDDHDKLQIFRTLGLLNDFLSDSNMKFGNHQTIEGFQLDERIFEQLIEYRVCGKMYDIYGVTEKEALFSKLGIEANKGFAVQVKEADEPGVFMVSMEYDYRMPRNLYNGTGLPIAHQYQVECWKWGDNQDYFREFDLFGDILGELKTVFRSEYYATATGSKYHVKGCPHLSKSKEKVELGEALKQGLAPCKICILTSDARF